MNCSKGIYILVEGPDDERFFKRILEPKLSSKYSFVHIIKYGGDEYKSTKNLQKYSNYIRAFLKSNNDYIFVVDIDDSPCVTYKKEQITNLVKNIDKENILVVKKEIESWYLAGAEDNFFSEFGISKFTINNTEKLSKEDFNKIIPRNFDRTDFMIELIKNFSVEKAKNRNKSFKYFMEKYIE
ncbi:hypothetical protein ELD05_00945 [Caldicellulosiruptor changbaiensis]|uniref:DUF4276 family protein n=1 Tax=Caldicellulosiruptor changbaiensis TaxID=1222016 RepID=A0A3T0D3H2_9FIRM|nr:hypothetical protein [Caldicellulosiruptor changbaiensis]AZT89366.1 hypothetical protein ELD05_00945 [Caldicellulosiruptor changbaiensis]